MAKQFSKEQMSAIKEAFFLVDELTQYQIDEFKKDFYLFEHDQSGGINIKGLAKAMNSLGLKPTKDELQRMINDVDIDRNGTIDFTEFLTMMVKQIKDNDKEDETKEIFRVFDKDGSGTIDAEEVRHVLHNLGEKLSDKEVGELMKEADIDGNGEIDYEEFITLMHSISVKG